MSSGNASLKVKANVFMKRLELHAEMAGQQTMVYSLDLAEVETLFDALELETALLAKALQK